MDFDVEPSEQTRPKARKRGNGKGITRTPVQLERQERVYELSVVYGLTFRQIAKTLKISNDTVIADMRAEAKRRAEETAERRDNALQESVDYYVAVGRKALEIAQKAKMPGDSARVGDAIKARERIDKLYGLDAPTRVDVGVDEFVKALIAKDE